MERKKAVPIHPGPPREVKPRVEQRVIEEEKPVEEPSIEPVEESVPNIDWGEVEEIPSEETSIPEEIPVQEDCSELLEEEYPWIGVEYGEIPLEYVPEEWGTAEEIVPEEVGCFPEDGNQFQEEDTNSIDEGWLIKSIWPEVKEAIKLVNQDREKLNLHQLITTAEDLVEQINSEWDRIERLIINIVSLTAKIYFVKNRLKVTATELAEITKASSTEELVGKALDNESKELLFKLAQGLLGTLQTKENLQSQEPETVEGSPL